MALNLEALDQKIAQHYIDRILINCLNARAFARSRFAASTPAALDLLLPITE